eukprot:SM000304S11856  [mRNA]  locus=s304:118630:122224:- [translate_table: standard]
MALSAEAVDEDGGKPPEAAPPNGGVRRRPVSPRLNPKVIKLTKDAVKRQTERIAQKADEHEHLINKVTYCVGVVAFGALCFMMGARPQDIPYLYCAVFAVATPLRWAYYWSKKWHYFLLDFCYYANVIFISQLLFFPKSEKLFLVCFSFAEGPLAWALIIWRCSLVFSSLDKILSVLIHLLPGTVIFIIRWWDPITFAHHGRDETGPWPAWPIVEGPEGLWTWLFFVPLGAYTLWQALYFIIVDGIRRKRMMRDPQVMTSYRELSRKAARANNLWWRLSGVLGKERRNIMYAILQAFFTVATMALTVPMFKSYRLHAAFQLFKIGASVWNGGNFFFDVMPRQVTAKAEKKKELKAGKARVGAASDGGTVLPPQPSADAEAMHEEKMKEVAIASTLLIPESELPHLSFCRSCRQLSKDSLHVGDIHSQGSSLASYASLDSLAERDAGALEVLNTTQVDEEAEQELGEGSGEGREREDSSESGLAFEEGGTESAYGLPARRKACGSEGGPSSGVIRMDSIDRVACAS